jgi:SRSO17 transposase
VIWEVIAMTAPRPCPPAPGPLEDYTKRFDHLFHTLAQRRSFRAYLTGLLLPHDRNKTLTALAGAEPVVQAQAAAVQRLQFFLSEADWDAQAINAQRLALMAEQPMLASHARGVLVVDDSGDRKDGHATAHVARQYIGSRGKIDNGIVAVTTLWADERCYWPLHAQPYTPKSRLPLGEKDPAFRTKPQIAMELIEQARQSGIKFEAVVADCFYGDNDGLEWELRKREIPYVMARRGKVGLGWAPAEMAHSFQDAALELPRRSWRPITRYFRDGHTEQWWAAELKIFGYGPDREVRSIVATTDPATLPPLTTWYLTTNISADQAPVPHVVWLYGMRAWIEEHYKRVKDELGWADFMVRGDHAIRRHWTLVWCAFSFCWWHEVQRAKSLFELHQSVSCAPKKVRGKNEETQTPGAGLLAAGAASRPIMAGPVEVAQHLLAGVARRATAA